MRRILSLVLLWLLATVLIAEARFVKTWWNPGSAAVLPFQGLGDILTNVVTYHSAYSCYQNNQVSSTVALVKDLATGATSTTLGCVGPIGSGTGVPVVTAGSPLATTCASTCIIDTAYDPSSGNNCSSAPCNLTQTQNLIPRGRNQNPTYVLNCAPNGSSACLHFQGWANGPSQSVASSSYNSTTGVVTLTMTATIYYVPGGSVFVSGITGTGSVASLNGNFVTIAPTGGTTISYRIATSLTLTTNAATGSTTANAQTLNNDVGTFAQVNEPYTVVALMTSDGFQSAGTSGGPNANHLQQDSTLKVGWNTTPTGGAGGPPTLTMYNGNTAITACSSGCTITTSVSYGSWYSLLAVFDNSHTGPGGNPNSWFCINGTCTQVNLGGSLNWASGTPANNTGYSEGNGSGGWGGRWLESAMTTSDQHAQAAAVYANQKARFGNF